VSAGVSHVDFALIARLRASVKAHEYEAEARIAEEHGELQRAKYCRRIAERLRAEP
jgi:hypothetical protein